MTKVGHIKIYEEFSGLQEKIDTLRDILCDLEDDDFYIEVKESFIEKESISIIITRQGVRYFEFNQILDYVNRCISYMKLEGYIACDINHNEYKIKKDQRVLIEGIVFLYRGKSL